MKRRKFLTGASTSMMILVFPVLKLFGRTDQSEDICSREPDTLLEIVRKYGPEFGGGQNVSI